MNLILPATSANLGPAFDAAALAMRLFLRIRTEASPEFLIRAQGRDAEICSRLPGNLILKTYRDVLTSAGKKAPPLALTINNEIPIGKGCGSSAAARLAGIALAVHFGKLSWGDERIISEAARREGHPDNASACWLGGLTVARTGDGGETQALSLAPKGNWPLLLAIPEDSLPTEEARQVLPKRYARKDAVANIQNSMLLLAALVQGRPDLLSAALDDRLHQPYRSKLCPVLPALQKLRSDAAILGVALSGAGPSVLVFVNPAAKISTAASQVRKRLRAAGITAELVPTQISAKGGKASFSSGRSRSD